MNLKSAIKGIINTAPPRAQAVVLFVTCAALFSSSHAIMKHLTTDLHPFVVAFFRNGLAFMTFVPWLLQSGMGGLKTERFGMHFVRATVNAAAIMLWTTALSIMPLADATALSLTGPLFMTIGAMLFLGEDVSSKRWTALVFGLAGGLIIIRPGFETVSIGAILVIFRAISQSISKLMAKSLSRTDDTATIVAYVTLLMTPISLVPALFYWQWPGPVELAWLAAAAVVAVGGNICMVQAYKLSDVTAVEPIMFTRLVWAALIGYFVFAEIPDFWMWGGAVLIVASTTYLSRPDKDKAGTKTNSSLSN